MRRNDQFEMRMAHERREARAKAAVELAKQAGLLACGKQSRFFQMLGIGQGRPTSFIRNNKSRKTKIREQWWAPARLVTINQFLVDNGLSSKVRSKYIRILLEDKPMPPRLEEAVATYTERLILASSRASSNTDPLQFP